VAAVGPDTFLARTNPFRTALGIGVEFTPDGGSRVSAPVRPAGQGPDGRLAPGAVLTLLDIALGHAIAARLPSPSSFATVSLQVTLRGAWPIGPLLAEGRADPLAPDWRDATAQARLSAPDGDVLADAAGYFARRWRSATRVGPMAAARPPAGSFAELLGAPESGCGWMEVREHLLNPDGVLHGGAMAALLDAAMRGALAARGPESFALRSMSVRYLLAACPGPLEISGDVERRGRRIHFARATARDADGRLLAAAEGTYASDDA